jgi:Cu/Ag efflux protein CusF
MNALKTLALAALMGTTLCSLPVLAQGMDHSKMAQAAKPTAAADMTEGEIRKIDKDNKKLTIKHGEIKNLDMPGMTMVFQVRDNTMVDQVKVGDKVRFKVERAGSGFVVTELQQAGK